MNNDFDFISETKLMGYGESDSSGAWIKLQVLPEELEIFRGLKGEVFETSLRNVDRGPLKVPDPVKGPHGKFARDIVLSGFFNSAKVREFFGGDDAYQRWVRTQPSAINGEFSEVGPDGELTNVYAHVRRAGESGTAYKPKYSGIPLTNDQPQDQHHQGETECLVAREFNTKGKTGPEWFEAQASKHLNTWLTNALKHHLGVESMTNISPAAFYGWAAANGLSDQVPKKLTDYIGEKE